MGVNRTQARACSNWVKCPHGRGVNFRTRAGGTTLYEMSPRAWGEPFGDRIQALKVGMSPLAWG